jgi:hypothetical protein
LRQPVVNFILKGYYQGKSGYIPTLIMLKLIILLCALFAVIMILLTQSQGAISVLLILALTLPTVYLVRRNTEDSEFLLKIFLIALLVRIGAGLVIHIFELRNVFGPDAFTYDEVGARLVDMWYGLPVPDDLVTERAKVSTSDVGWGMYHLVGFIYLICGRGIFIAQSFCAFVGAATIPVVYFCAKSFFNNQRVARNSAIAVALFPSFIIWSSQLLKDGLIVFLLVFTITMVLHLQKKFSYLTVVLLVLSLFGIVSLRFYIFYMIAVAVAGSFIIGLSTSFESIVRRVIAVIVIGLALTYLGVIRSATTNFQQYGSLERVQISRQDLARSAKSGFGEDLDVSTTEGAISAIPIGLLYLMFAPFPWQIQDYKTAFLLPEMIVWWSLIPIMMMGLWYTVKNRFRPAIPILIFTLMLTLAYSIFQGNVGMTYRQRTQIQVFLFIFISVGWTLMLERRENKKMQMRLRENRLKQKLQIQQVKS